MAAAHAGALSSDHVNYLIFRYLQESGHEKTAHQFALDWHRPHEYHQPEDLPFAHTVHRSELVSVIQNGITYDELQARVGRNERRFRWTMGGSVGPRESVEEDGVGMEERENGSRPPSSGKRKGRAPGAGGMRAPDEFPTPVAKRQRVSHETEGVHVNGDRDAMDVDAASASPGDAESTANEDESAAAESDFELPAERYDSMDVAVQTDARTKKSTSWFTLPKPGARILHASWSPGNLEGDRGTLMAVGEELCRVYSIPELLPNGEMKTPLHVDQPELPPNSVVTATAWHPDGRIATCAVDTVEDLPGGKQISRQSLVDIGGDIGVVTYPRDVPLLEPPGIITNIRYSPKGAHILVMRSNFKRSCIQIWQTRPDPENAHDRKDPQAWRIYEHQVLDAAWQTEDTFIVCGKQNFVRHYKLTQASRDSLIQISTTHNLSERAVDLEPDHDHTLSKFTSSTTWDKILLEPHCGGCIVASPSTTSLLAITMQLGDKLATEVYFDARNGNFTALAVAPQRPTQLSTEVLTEYMNLCMYATASGACVLCDVGAQDGTGNALVRPIVTLRLGEPVRVLAFSPDGNFVAAAGGEKIRVWKCALENVSNCEVRMVDERAVVEWHRADHMDDTDVEEHDGNSAEPTLSWSADGERLSYALDKQISIISFNPPLSVSAVEQINGGASP